MKILIMGLPGSGKTTLAKCLYEQMKQRGFMVDWFNADEIRARHNDWDFSESGRLRQALRMRALCSNSDARLTICDFVAPIEMHRRDFGADFTIWLDTIAQGRYENTNAIFTAPSQYDVRVTTKDAPKWVAEIYEKLSNCITD